MKKIVGFIMLYICLFSIQSVAEATARDIASQWAPVICQVDNSDGLKAQQNIFTFVNYDYDWRLNNNWYNLLFYQLERAMYYSVVESDSHYFIGYYQYYPRHIDGGDHEHDLTGVLIAVSKTSDGSGQFDMLVTYNNNKWQKWKGSQVRLEGGHPVLNISAATHEITTVGKSNRALPAASLYEISSSGGSHASYHLIPLTQLWDHRQDIGQGRVFARWGYFDSYNAVKVKAPWVWEYRQINWLTNPDELIQHFKRRPVKSCNYLSNPYQLSI